jgi:predicted nucleotide-binding protein
MPAKKSAPAIEESTKESKKRVMISQSDIPAYSLEDALRVPTAIRDNFGKGPTTPTRLAGALKLSPTSSSFRMLCGASIAYGFTIGGYNAASISLAPLSDRILRPTVEGGDLTAKREAFFKPRVPREFLTRYDGSALPSLTIAHNILSEDFGVAEDRAPSLYAMIVETAKQLGLTHDIKGKTYVDLGTPGAGKIQQDQSEFEAEEQDYPEDGADEGNSLPMIDRVHAALFSSAAATATGPTKRIFITHGKNRAFIDPIKKMLSYGELEPVVSVENNTTSVPIPGKVMDDMRSCSGAIIHVEADMVLKDSKGEDVAVLNPNVLIEIGAAIALYGRRYILLVKDGVKVPSNLQGLYEVRYAGDILDVHETLKLLESINDLKKQPLPS